MSRLAVPSARPAVVQLILLLALCGPTAVAAAAPAARVARAAGCSVGRSEVRFDDGRLLVTRAARAVSPRTVRERWVSCWRPSSRRSVLADVRHAPDADELALVAVRRGRFVVLGAAGHLDVYDGRLGRTTATLPQVGVVRELAITSHGRAAALQDTGAGARQLWAGSGTRGCFLDAGAQTSTSGDVFGDLAVHRERVAWHRDGIAFGMDLSSLSC